MHFEDRYSSRLKTNFKLTEPTLDERTAGGKPAPCLSATHILKPS